MMRNALLPALLLAALSVEACQADPHLARPAPLLDGEYQVDIHNVTHWYRIAGAEHRTVPLVIVHGGPGGNTYSFERTAGPALEQFTTVIYYDQRGSGRSAPPADSTAYSISILVADLESLRVHLGVPRIDLLGFSFGGELALEYALAHPGRVEHLVLEAPTTGDWDRLQQTQLDGFRAVSAGAVGEEVRRIMASTAPLSTRWDQVWSVVDERTVDRLLFHDAEAARINRKLWRESGLRNTGQMLRALLTQPSAPVSLLDRARTNRAPILVLVGLYDRNVGVDAVRDLADIIPGARLVVFDRSAHFPDAEEPDRYAAVVRCFLETPKSRWLAGTGAG